jgi:hypothetical protein
MEMARVCEHSVGDARATAPKEGGTLHYWNGWTGGWPPKRSLDADEGEDRRCLRASTSNKPSPQAPKFRIGERHAEIDRKCRIVYWLCRYAYGTGYMSPEYVPQMTCLRICKILWWLKKDFSLGLETKTLEAITSWPEDM